MTIIFFGTYNVETTPRVKVLLEGCIDNAVDIYECNAPLPLNTNQRVAILKAPWRLPLLLLKLIQCWLQLIGKRLRAPKSEAVLIGNIGQFDIRLARILFPKRHLILDYMISAEDTARDRGVKGGIKLSLLHWLDKAALKRADTILVDTEAHKATIAESFRDKVVVVHVGASNVWFHSTENTNNNDSLRVIFFGSYTPLQGAPIIGEAIGQLTEPMQIAMIGTGQDEAPTKLLASLKKDIVSVRWMDWLTTNDLVSELSNNDVCLGIFGNSSKAQRVVPNKIYQGAAMGLALITSNTPPQKRILGDAARYVSPANSRELSDALNELAKNRSTVNDMKKQAKQLAEKEFRPKEITAPLIALVSKLQR